MAIQQYNVARKRAQKAYRQDIANEKYPYLKVLDEILPFTQTAGETDLGLIEIPIDKIVGTKTAGRTRAFSSTFMPLLDDTTEFASKWSALYKSHISEGIQEPIIACEFMNSYYVIEGNKRVSVLKYSGAVSVPGYVTRIIPAYSDDPEIKQYYKFMEFSRFSGLHNITFTKPDSYHELCRLVGKEYGNHWTLDERRIFSSRLYRFTEVFLEKGGDKIAVTVGDAFLLYLEIYGYEQMKSLSQDTFIDSIENLWKEFEALPFEGNVSHIMQPEQEPEKNMLQNLLFPLPQKLTVGFIYHKTAQTSAWTYAHDLGRLYLEDNMGGKLDIHVYDNVNTEEECEDVLERAIEDGCNVIFTTSARFLSPSLKACIRHPEIKILNCSLNAYSGHLRTYYGRLYEAKFLVGMLAGILTRTDTIGYIADSPIFGTPASINAFALGVKMVNPSAMVKLVWSSEKDCDVYKELKEANVSHICGRDMIAPRDTMRSFGLYDLDDENGGNLAASIWHWGKFYQRILQTILNGNWKRTPPVPGYPSVNYWWGISSGIIDIICSKSIPSQTMKLVEMVKKQIINDEFKIFSGELYDQNHVLRHEGNDVLSPDEIVKMNWLADNVIGYFPKIEKLDKEAAAMAEVQGIELL